jgi:hypothetical protein
VTNPAAAVGGDEAESVRLARKRMPRLYRSNDRCVNKQDFEAQAESFPGVVQSLAVVSGISQWTVYVAPHPSVGVGTGTDPFGYAVLGTTEQSQDALAQAVLADLQPKVMHTDTVDVKIVRFRPVDSKVSITLNKGANRLQVEQDLVAFLGAEFFDVRNLSIGEDVRTVGHIRLGDWIQGLENLDGVDFTNVESFQLRPQLETIQTVLVVPELRSAGYTKFTTDSIWEIQFLDTQIYRVYRKEIDSPTRVLQTQIGTLDQGFIADKEDMQFVLALPAGETNTMQSGDRFEFRVSRLLGDVPIIEGEIGAQGTVNISLIGGV